MHTSVHCGDEDVTRESKETTVFSGTREQCENWIKIQCIDAIVKLIDLNEKVEVEKEILSWHKLPWVTITVSDRKNDISVYYYSTYYMRRSY